MNEPQGSGGTLPPKKGHVLIYFNEKGASEESALSFYAYWSARKWITRRRKTLSNWKVAAWTLINYQSSGL